MSLKATNVLVLVLTLLAATSGAVAQDTEDDRAEGALFLRLPVGAQGVSLGRAMTWAEGSEGAFWNPAGLAGISRDQVVLFRGDHVAGTATAITALFSGSSTTNAQMGTLGVSYFLLDAGDIDQTDASGNYTGTITIRNHLGIVSAATKLLNHLSAGVSFKVIRFQLACRGICGDEGTTATTYAIDGGIQGHLTRAIRFGAMVSNLGPSLQVLNAEQADPLPSRFRVAVAYDVVGEIIDRADVHGWIAVEIEDRVRGLRTTSIYLGTELTAGVADALSLRAGYAWSDLAQEDGARVGLGLSYERFDLSIAKSLAVSTLTGETEPVHVTFSIDF